MDRVSGKFGYETAKGLLSAAATVGTAQWVRATYGFGPWVKGLADAIVKNPGTTAVMELGAGPGAVLGAEASEGATAAPVTGGIVGALGGAMLGTKAGKLGKGVGAILGAIPGVIGGQQLPGAVEEVGATLTGAMAGASLAGRGVRIAEGVGRQVGKLFDGTKAPTQAVLREPDRVAVKRFAENQIQGELDLVDDEINRVVQTVPVQMQRGRPVTSPEAQERVLAGIDRAEEIGNKIQKRYWREVDQTAKVPGGPVIQELDLLRSDSTASKFVPREIEALEKFFQPQDPVTGQTRPVPTVRGVLKAAQEIRAQRIEERNQTVREPNQARMDNLHTLEQLLYKHAEIALPGSIEAQQAARFSARMGEMFNTGLVAQIRNGMRAQGQFQGNVVERLLADRGGRGLEEALNNIRELQNAPRPFSVPQGMGATAAEQAQLAKLRADYETAISTEFRAIADTQGPEAGAKFFEANKEKIKPLANAYADLDNTVTQVRALQDHKKAIDQSALARITKEDPEPVVQRLFTSPTASRQAAELMRVTAKDPYAQQGLKDLVLEDLFRRSRTSPDKTMVDPESLNKHLRDPKVRRMLEIVVGPDTLKRIDKMADIANRLERGDIEPLGKRVAQKAEGLAGIPGAYIGRMLNRLVGGGAVLQAPAYGSKVARGWLNNLMKGEDPSQLLAKAAQDPHWEKLLYEREPVMTKEIIAMRDKVRRLVAVERAGMEQAARKWEASTNADEREREPKFQALPRTARPVQFTSLGPGDSTSGVNTNKGLGIGNITSQGNITPRSAAGHIRMIGRHVRPRAFERAMAESPRSTNIEDRRRTKNLGGYREFVEDLDRGGYTHGRWGGHETGGSAFFLRTKPLAREKRFN